MERTFADAWRARRWTRFPFSGRVGSPSSWLTARGGRLRGEMMTRHLWRSLLGLLVGVLALTVVASAGAAMRGSGPIHGAARDCPQGTCMALTVTLNGHPVSYRSLGRSVAGRATSIGASTARGSVVANDVTAFTPTGIHDGYNLPWNSGVQQTIALIDAYYHPSMKNDL